MHQSNRVLRVSDPGRWRVLGGSVQGSGHRERGEPCQDACCMLRLDTDEGEVLLLVASDGAGSASHAQVGSHLACETIVRAVTSWFQEGAGAPNLNEGEMEQWVQQAIQALEEESRTRDLPLRELACTLLVAIVAPEAAAFAQVGDGAIVINHREGYSPVFWPQNGEYANTTYFLTEPEATSRALYSLIRGTVDEVALFTDGIQALALHYDSRTAYAPFFIPLFARLRREPAGIRDEMKEALSAFLDSAAVNERTDDDKTLLLATRRAPEWKDWLAKPARAHEEETGEEAGEEASRAPETQEGPSLRAEVHDEAEEQEPPHEGS